MKNKIFLLFLFLAITGLSWWRYIHNRDNYDLIDAAREGQLIKVKFLVTLGVNVNIVTSKGATAFEAAAGHPEVVAYLKSKGATQIGEDFVPVKNNSRDTHLIQR